MPVAPAVATPAINKYASIVSKNERKYFGGAVLFLSSMPTKPKEAIVKQL